MASASASAQIASAVKATLNGYDLPRISNAPNILTVKEFTVKLCQMAVTVESDNAGGKFGHMHLILKEKEYRIATKNTTANVGLLKKPLDVNPEFQSLKKDELTKYKVLQLEAETRQKITAYLTQEETSKELMRWMVASIEMEYIKELDNEYTGYNNETAKSILAHLATEYCKATVANQLKADGKFAKPWDQVTNLGMWITRLEVLRRKCDEVGVSIDDGRMVLKITENAKKCALFNSVDHKAYDKLQNYNLDTVVKFWVKKYKAHNIYNQLQAIANEYESVAYAGPPTSSAGSIANDNDTYISILKETLARLTMECKSAFAVTNRAAKRTPSNTLATNTMNEFCQQLMTEMKNEMAKVLAAVMTAAKVGTSNGGGGTGGGGTGGVGAGGDTGCSRGRRIGSNLPLCPHCRKKGKHKPDDCFSLPANAGKKPANFIDVKFVYEKKVE
jgi:hypothetical protein